MERLLVEKNAISTGLYRQEMREGNMQELVRRGYSAFEMGEKRWTRKGSRNIYEFWGI